MKYLWTTITVKDLEKSIAFYTDLADLKLQRRFPGGPGMEIAFLGNGTDNETLVELIADSNAEIESYGDGIMLGFEIESVEAMMENVRNRNIPVFSGPITTPSGGRFFCIKDPDGLTVQFFQQG